MSHILNLQKLSTITNEVEQAGSTASVCCHSTFGESGGSGDSK